MSRRRPIDRTTGLDQTRRSMGDGTLAGRARIATPYDPRRLRRPGSVVSPRRGGPDPRTITVEAIDVEVPPRDRAFEIAWQAASSPLTTVRFPEPDYPATELEIPTRGVWRPRIEVEWDPDEFGDGFLGGGEILLRVNGVIRWPLGAGTTAPVGAGQHRAFVGTLPDLQLAMGDRVSVSIENPDGSTRVLSRALLTLAQLEPFRAATGEDPDPITEIGINSCTDTGPTLWARFHGQQAEIDPDPTNLYRQIAGAECAPGWGGNGPDLSANGPYGPAARAIDSSTIGSYLEGGTPSGGQGSTTHTILMRFRNDGDGGGYWVFRNPVTGAGTGESSGRGFTKPGATGVTFRLKPSSGTGSPTYEYTVDGLTVGRWYTVVGTHDEDTGRVRVYLDGDLRIDETEPALATEITNGRQRVMSGRNVFGEHASPITNGALAELIMWAHPLSPEEVRTAVSSLGGN